MAAVEGAPGAIAGAMLKRFGECVKSRGHHAGRAVAQRGRRKGSVPGVEGVVAEQTLTDLQGLPTFAKALMRHVR